MLPINCQISAKPGDISRQYEYPNPIRETMWNETIKAILETNNPIAPPINPLEVGFSLLGSLAAIINTIQLLNTIPIKVIISGIKYKGFPVQKEVFVIGCEYHVLNPNHHWSKEYSNTPIPSIALSEAKGVSNEARPTIPATNENIQFFWANFCLKLFTLVIGVSVIFKIHLLFIFQIPLIFIIFKLLSKNEKYLYPLRDRKTFVISL